jgi:hypothetical protein
MRLSRAAAGRTSIRHRRSMTGSSGRLPRLGGALPVVHDLSLRSMWDGSCGVCRRALGGRKRLLWWNSDGPILGQVAEGPRYARIAWDRDSPGSRLPPVDPYNTVCRWSRYRRVASLRRSEVVLRKHPLGIGQHQVHARPPPTENSPPATLRVSGATVSEQPRLPL